ncbi:hypothetical protein SSBR45G_71540 [Bradyrhizobium sp. SSBR45G]|uniref:hypothetical protein n=1 Tax=unclassified Bradyrhizobium TaxID=2631580 RepID=UPI002342A90D|nr:MULTISPECIES: hypothetical protein [unclassified Bradyrhizobium]GLH82245.1 hypothetical protein SSBR45G_71540 [Bradyrhizobium sp. SSBR45G]GLH89677.1 hypothetical protein SSBR45R_71380 [Bradyrhizobium sp. SSBR45R]
MIGSIVISEMVLAELVHGSKPGWSRLAAQDGPLALRLTRERLTDRAMPQR